MSYALTLGALHVISDTAEELDAPCNCAEAQEQCRPSFVFSVAGQVGFRTALKHLANCSKMDCRTLRSRVFDTMQGKMRWLMKEESLLGCIHIQPALYGERRVVMAKKDFPTIAQHLARCPKETCAQLRRAVLLDIRDELRPN
jgi:hypothetical protein